MKITLKQALFFDKRDAVKFNYDQLSYERKLL